MKYKEGEHISVGGAGFGSINKRPTGAPYPWPAYKICWFPYKTLEAVWHKASNLRIANKKVKQLVEGRL